MLGIHTFKFVNGAYQVGFYYADGNVNNRIYWKWLLEVDDVDLAIKYVNILNGGIGTDGTEKKL